jgi:hypothetical protein
MDTSLPSQFVLAPPRAGSPLTAGLVDHQGLTAQEKLLKYIVMLLSSTMTSDLRSVKNVWLKAELREDKTASDRVVVNVQWLKGVENLPEYLDRNMTMALQWCNATMTTYQTIIDCKITQSVVDIDTNGGDITDSNEHDHLAQKGLVVGF